jgi:transposase
MLNFNNGLKIYLALEPCDMRKSFNGLHGLVLSRLGEDPASGALFVFTNKRRTRLKIFFFDGNGTWVLAKRLEKGTFCWPSAPKGQSNKLFLTSTELQLILEGIDLRQTKERRWIRRHKIV